MSVQVSTRGKALGLGFRDLRRDKTETRLIHYTFHHICLFWYHFIFLVTLDFDCFVSSMQYAKFTFMSVVQKCKCIFKKVSGSWECCLLNSSFNKVCIEFTLGKEKKSSICSKAELQAVCCIQVPPSPSIIFQIIFFFCWT